MHLARELAARGAGSGADVVVLEKTPPGRRRLRDRLRRRPQQLLPAGDERADAGLRRGLGLRSRPRTTTTRSATSRSARRCRRSDLTAVHERHERIGYRSDLILGEAEVDAHMKALFPDWRAQGVTVCLHDHRGRLRLQPGVRERAARQVRGGGRVGDHRRRGDRVRLPGRRQRRRARDERRPDRGRRAGRDRTRPVGEAVLGDARPARRGSTSTRRRARCTSRCRCGRTGTCRRARSPSTR